MKKLAKEIPINCKICVYCIQDENGKFFCSFDESNPNLLGLLECHELKLGIISLVEYLEERDKKISALEEWKKAWSVQISDYIEKYGKRIEALESQFKQLTDILCSDDYASIISELNEFKKQLEENTEYYDVKTLTHFISDIEDWIKTNKHEEFDGTAYWCVDVSGLEQFLIDRKKQMMRYNKTKTKKQLEGKQ